MHRIQRILSPHYIVVLHYSLVGCRLSDQHCESLSSALQSSNSLLTELILNNNDLKDSGVKRISVGLKSSDCQLKILRFELHIDCFIQYVEVC